MTFFKTIATEGKQATGPWFGRIPFIRDREFKRAQAPFSVVFGITNQSLVQIICLTLELEKISTVSAIFCIFVIQILAQIRCQEKGLRKTAKKIYFYNSLDFWSVFVWFIGQLSLHIPLDQSIRDVRAQTSPQFSSLSRRGESPA